jgi:hypothetical protein
MQRHDSAYKTLFSEPQMVRSLLLDVVKQPWVHQLDWASLERQDSSFISKRLAPRQSDLIWRVKLNSQPPEQAARWLYVFLLIEFQSSIDPYMALRMMTYTGLLYERLLKQKIDGKKFKGKLPAVLPLVIYNGEARWTAPLNMADLIEPTDPQLQSYQPSMNHLVLDLLRLPTSGQLDPQSHIAAVIDFEQAPNPEHINALVQQLSLHLIGPANAHLREAFVIWIHGYIIERFAAQNKMLELGHPQDLTELQTMTRSQAQAWKNTIRQEGILAGKIQGQALGEAREAKGKAEGKVEAKAETLRRQLTRKYKIALPAQYEALIAQASIEQLDVWLDMLLEVDSLQELFDRH